MIKKEKRNLMKKIALLLLLPSLLLAGCGNSAATSLTLENASKYIELWGGDAAKGNSSSSTNDGKGTYTVLFDLYPTKYEFNHDVKGTCNFTFTPTDGHYVNGKATVYDSVKVANAAFAWHDNGTGTDGTKQQDSLQGSFTFTNAALPNLNSSPITDFVFLTISGSVLGGN
jgi:hypothetical protein